MPDIQVFLLGEFQVVVAGRAIELSAPKAQALFACLASEPNHVVALDRLEAAIWGIEGPRSARNALQVYVSQWRRSIRAASAPMSIKTSRYGYELRIDPELIDASRLDELSKRGSDLVHLGEFRHAAGLLRQAVELWRGPPLVGLDDLPIRQWLTPRLTQVWNEARILEATACLEIGHVDIAVATLRELQTEVPDSERVLSLLMRALYLSGHQREALRLYESARRKLQESGLDPSPALREMQRRILQHDPDLIEIRRERLTSSVPAPVGEFVGERAIIESVVESLEEGRTRLVTLTGFGGVGKTRCSLEVALMLAAQHQRTAVFVPLASVSGAKALRRSIVAALKIEEILVESDAVAIARAIPTQPLLLILDRAEHIISEVRDLVSVLLAESVMLTVLVTSRVRTDLPGEFAVEVPSLRSTVRPDERLSEVPAVSFMLAATGGGKLTEISEKELRSIQEICGYLDGNPLALEIAAPRVRALGAEQVAVALRKGLHFLRRSNPLSESTHNSVEATIEWSYSLLSAKSQVAIAALAHLPGGFGVEHLGVLLPDFTGDDAIEAVEEIVNQSFASHSRSSGSLRFVLPNLVREYFLEKVQTGVEVAYWDRYREWILAALAGVQSSHPAWASRYDDLENEQGNVRALVVRAIRLEDRIAISRLCLVLYEWWMYRGRRVELLGWLEVALAWQSVDETDELTLRLLAGRVAAQLGQYERSSEHLAIAGSFDRSAGHPAAVAAEITRAENDALIGDTSVARAKLLSLESSPVVLNDEQLLCRLRLAQAIVEQLAGDLIRSDEYLDRFEDIGLATAWVDARVKAQVVRADNYRLSGRPLESAAVLERIRASVQESGSFELRELVSGFLATLSALSGDGSGVLAHAMESLSSMPPEARDIDSVLRVMLSLNTLPVPENAGLRRAVDRLLALFLDSFPTPKLLANELRLFPNVKLVSTVTAGVPNGWIDLADDVLYELRRAVATGSAR